MRIWRYSRWDGLLLSFSLLQLTIMFIFAFYYENYTGVGKFFSFLVCFLMMTYNIIVVSHLFMHAPWFVSDRLNAFISMLNSINIGQSVQVYQFMHVRNHHVYNNDQKDHFGNTKDFFSTFQYGEGNSHATLHRYVCINTIKDFVSIIRNELFSWPLLFALGKKESEYHQLLSRTLKKRQREKRQIKLDRFMCVLTTVCFFMISWRWTLFCYFPAFYLTLFFVNIQNYFEHYGAAPQNNMANAVSYYGKVYNFLTFNDGYHQEHHLRPVTHWKRLPEIYREYRTRFDDIDRIISPVPAILGFLDRKRLLLHTRSGSTDTERYST